MSETPSTIKNGRASIPHLSTWGSKQGVLLFSALFWQLCLGRWSFVFKTNKTTQTNPKFFSPALAQKNSFAAPAVSLFCAPGGCWGFKRQHLEKGYLRLCELWILQAITRILISAPLAPLLCYKKPAAVEFNVGYQLSRCHPKAREAVCDPWSLLVCSWQPRLEGPSGGLCAAELLHQDPVAQSLGTVWSCAGGMLTLISPGNPLLLDCQKRWPELL